MKLVLRDGSRQITIVLDDAPRQRAFRLDDSRCVGLLVVKLLLSNAALGARYARSSLVILGERPYEAAAIARSLNCPSNLAVVQKATFRTATRHSLVLMTVQTLVLVTVGSVGSVGRGG